jgi:tRNA A-37 threonylcarbamoyl transferase component Bud32
LLSSYSLTGHRSFGVLHHFSIVHGDLKPAHILMKSYNRCEINVIDLERSCFLTDNLSLKSFWSDVRLLFLQAEK